MEDEVATAVVVELAVTVATKLAASLVAVRAVVEAEVAREVMAAREATLEISPSDTVKTSPTSMRHCQTKEERVAIQARVGMVEYRSMVVAPSGVVRVTGYK